jgi:hypothetical protein
MLLQRMGVLGGHGRLFGRRGRQLRKLVPALGLGSPHDVSRCRLSRVILSRA